MSKRIVSCFLALAVLMSAASFALSAPASPEVVSTTNLWTIAKALGFEGFTMLVELIGPDGVLCESPDSADGHHRGHLTTGVVGTDGKYACECDLCGKPFLVPESEVDFPAAYDNYVDTLEYPIYTNDGGFCVSMRHTYSQLGYYLMSRQSYTCPHGGSSSYSDFSFSCSSSSASGSINSKSKLNNAFFHSFWTITLPVAGEYTCINYPSGSVSGWADGKYAANWDNDAFVATSFGTVSVATATHPAPVLKCIPDDAITAPSSSTRIGAINQVIVNYNNQDNSTKYYIGTVDQSTNVTNVYSPNIFDEQTLVYTEPVTGQQFQCTGWVYDYRSGVRGYDLTLTPGTYVYDGADIVCLALIYGDEALDIYGFTAEGLSAAQSSGDYPGNATFVENYSYVAVTTQEPDPEPTPEPTPLPTPSVDPTDFWDWWKDAWTAFTDRLWGSLGGGSDSPSPAQTLPPDTLFPGETPAPDAPEGEEGWTFLDLLSALKDGAWSIVKGTVSLAFDGFGGVVSAVTDIGNFFGGMGDLKSDMQQIGGDWNWTP